MPSTAPIKVPILGEDQYTKEFNKMVKKARKVGQAIASVGRTLTAAVTLPAIGIGVASLKMSRDLNKSLADVATLIPGQAKKLQGFRKEVLKMSVDFATGTDILSAGLYQTISAVGDTSDVMDILSISTRAAKAGVAEVKDSVNLLTKVSTAYGDTSKEMIQHVSDLSFLAVKLGVTTFPEMAASMGEIASTASSMGVGIKELFADTAALTKVLGGTAQATTALDAVMAELMRGSTDLDKVFRKLHVKSGEELIHKFGGLTGALEALKKSAGGTEIGLKKLFGRKEAMKAAGLLTGSLAQIIVDNKKQMQDASGATVQAFKEQTKGIDEAGFKYDQMVQQTKRLGVAIGDNLIPVASKLTGKISGIADALADASNEEIRADIKTVALVAAFGPMLIIIGKTTVAVANLVKVMKTVTPVLDSSIKAAGGLNVALGVLSAAVAGWTIGTIIHDQIIAPLMKASQAAQHLQEVVKGDSADKNEEKKSASILESRLRDAQKLYAQNKKEYDKARFDAQTRGIFLPEKSVGLSELESRITKLKSLISEKKAEASKPKQSVWKSPSVWNPDTGGVQLQTPSQETISRMQSGQVDGVIHIAFDNLPPGMKPKVERERGGKVKVKTGAKGPIMAGAH